MNTRLDSMQMPLPREFCWTRIGVEAGQSLQSIFHRKNQERAANGGLFFWGIGSAIGPSLLGLLRRCPQPELVFSPIKSAAKVADVNPESVVAWTQAESFEGNSYALPRQTLITSRLSLTHPKRVHYALVCTSDTALIPADLGTVDIGDLENLLTGRPIGASQVTAVVRYSGPGVRPTRAYSTVLKVKLQAPFLLRLQNPIALSAQDYYQCWEQAVSHFWEKKLLSMEA
jgi:hypothetical protein